MYQLVQFLVDPVTKSRIHIVKGDPKNFLPTVIPKENLPVEYGGTCQCAGGCIPVLDATELLARATNNAVDDSMGMDTQYISYDYEKVLECDRADSTFSWYFESKDGYDIDFSVEILPAGADPADSNRKKVYAKIPTRCTTSKGEYKSTAPCKLLFRWDNNFSYFNSKTVRYMCQVSQLSAQDESLLQSTLDTTS
jgi:hypothetical protein